MFLDLHILNHLQHSSTTTTTSMTDIIIALPNAKAKAKFESKTEVQALMQRIEALRMESIKEAEYEEYNWGLSESIVKLLKAQTTNTVEFDIAGLMKQLMENGKFPNLNFASVVAALHYVRGKFMQKSLKSNRNGSWRYSNHEFSKTVWTS